MADSDTPEFILEVRFYRTGGGVEPVREWLISLKKSAKKAIGEDIKTVQYGWPTGMPVVRKLEKGLWEVRSNIKDGIARVLFTVIDDTLILLHGFVKKSQLTPREELDVARKRMKSFHQE